MTLFGALCLFLFYNGGEESTGPIWYLVFPILSLFLQDRRTGLLSAGILLLLTYLMATLDLSALNPAIYRGAFIQRMLAVYITITGMSYLFAYFRHQAEKQLEIVNQQLETTSKTDKLSGLLNRRGMEESIDDMVEVFNRFQTT